MSYVFYVTNAGEHRTVWSPASRVGELYVGMLGVAAQSLHTPTGLRSLAADLHEMDPVAFETLVGHLMDTYSSSSHTELRMLLRGILPISIALLAALGISIEAKDPDREDIIRLGRSLSLPD